MYAIRVKWEMNPPAVRWQAKSIEPPRPRLAPVNVGQLSTASQSQNVNWDYDNGLALSGVNLYKAWELLMESALVGNLSYVPQINE